MTSKRCNLSIGAILTAAWFSTGACAPEGPPNDAILTSGREGGAGTPGHSPEASASDSNAPPPGTATPDGGALVITKPEGGEAPDAACAAVEQAAEALPATAADIIWIIDNSGSMSFESSFVQDNLNVFSRLITRGGVDSRVVLISAGSTGSGYGMCIRPPLGSGDCPDDTSYPHLFHVQETVDSNNALDKIMSTYPQWRGLLRAGVPKTFVVVTDDNSWTSATTFTSWVATQAAFQGSLWRFSGIFCINSGSPNCAAQGTVYNELVATTGGVAGDLSLQDFAPVFQQLASSVVIDAVPVGCEWTIPAPPNGQTLDPDKVNVLFTQEDGTTEPLYAVVDSSQCDDVHGGWYYDDAAQPTRVIACDSSCRVMQSDPHARVQVTFGCARRIRVVH